MHDVVVVSDLHIGRGRNPSTGRYHSRETFFYDEDFRRFCQWITKDAWARGTTATLILNGDTFDFLRAEAPDEAAQSGREERFGPDLTPSVAQRYMEEILAGHPVLVEAFADVLLGGGTLVLLPGNHDLEVQFTTVHDVFRRVVGQALTKRDLPAADTEAAASRIVFAPWFHYEPGRIWVEHGSQYDPECAFRYLLRGSLSESLPVTRALELDMPLGNFFQKYLYNAFGAITFIVPSTRANARYSRWLLVNQPGLLFRVIASHLPFIVQVVRRLSHKSAPGKEMLTKAHEAGLAELEQSSAAGKAVREIDALKRVRGDLVEAATEYGRQLIRLLLLSVAVVLLGACLWFSGFIAINEMSGGIGLKSLAFLALNFTLFLGLVGGSAYAMLRSEPGLSPLPLRQGAQKIIDLLHVPTVVFGHTHDEVIWRLYGKNNEAGWYFNTGTWIAVFTHDVLLPRERVQYTFFRMKGHEGELLQWSPGRGEPAPVILLDELRDAMPVVHSNQSAT